MTARYLLRLDDACPTMDHAGWRRLEVLFDELAIKPIVAVVPDNRDPDLDRRPAAADFWERAIGWQGKGWTIGLHGYQHVLRPSRGRQFLPFHSRSEFVGRSTAEQADAIRGAWTMITAKGLTPTVWIAPAHSFDAATLAALRAETPVRTVSDGIARDQFDAHGFRWIPQQLWSLTPKAGGLWTVCLHPNTMSDHEFATLERQLRGEFAGRIVGLADVPTRSRTPSIGDRIEAARFWRRHYTQRAIVEARKLVHR